MKIAKGILLALVVVAISTIKSWAVDGQAIQIQGTNILLSWPSLGYEYYMIQYWPDLASPSVQLTNNFPANSTNRTMRFLRFCGEGFWV